MALPNACHMTHAPHGRANTSRRDVLGSHPRMIDTPSEEFRKDHVTRRIGDGEDHAAQPGPVVNGAALFLDHHPPSVCAYARPPHPDSLPWSMAADRDSVLTNFPSPSLAPFLCPLLLLDPDGLSRRLVVLPLSQSCLFGHLFVLWVLPAVMARH